jgi:hypothetical protein
LGQARLQAVHVAHRDPDREPDYKWSNPIGARYASWHKLKPGDRRLLMLETAVELMADGFEPGHVLSEFAKVDAFFALGRESYPMCRSHHRHCRSVAEPGDDDV